MASRAIVVVMAIWMLFTVGEKILNPYLLQINHRKLLADAVDRARLESQLNQIPGQHLVIVHNHWSHTGSEDWIYNKPDLDRAKIVWARDMGPEANQDLLQYFPDRKVWVVDQNDGLMRLTAYNQRTPQETVAAAALIAAAHHK